VCGIDQRRGEYADRFGGGSRVGYYGRGERQCYCCRVYEIIDTRCVSLKNVLGVLARCSPVPMAPCVFFKLKVWKKVIGTKRGVYAMC